MFILFFFFNDTATTEIYTLSLHDALPIWRHDAVRDTGARAPRGARVRGARLPRDRHRRAVDGSARTSRLHHRLRSEEHTSELQSRQYLVCRLLLEKKKKNQIQEYNST